MKNFHRRLATSLLSVVLLTTALPTGALAEEPEEVPQSNAEPVCTCTCLSVRFALKKLRHQTVINLILRPMNMK